MFNIFSKVYYVGQNHECHKADEKMTDDFFWNNSVKAVVAKNQQEAVKKYDKGEYVK